MDTSRKSDDLEAVRAVVTALVPFNSDDQERILRWAREKLGLPTGSPQNAELPAKTGSQSSTEAIPGGAASAQKRRLTIKEFVDQKSPRSDNQFAAVVAYYYRFESPESERKGFITAEDLQDACRKAGRDRLAKPSVTLNNAHSVGLLDRGQRGEFTINAVGENLVAMTLPAAADGSRARKPKRNSHAPGKRTKSSGRQTRRKR